MTDNKNDIPRHWKVKAIKELCSNISLGQKKLKQKDYLNQGSFPVIDQGQALIGGYTNDSELLINEAPPFIVFGDHTKITKYITTKFVAGADGVKVLKPNSFINSKFLFYAIRAIQLPDKGYARHFQFLNKIKVCYPENLSEQKAIVEKIEEYFSELDKGIEELRTAQDQLKVYRQSLLKWAFEGKLTNDNVEEGKLPKGWKWVNIDSLLLNKKNGMTTGPFGSLLKKQEHKDDGVIVLGIENIGEGSFKMPNKIFVTKEKALELKKYQVKSRDIIISRSGTVGEICCVPLNVVGALISTNLIKLTLDENNLIPHYFVYMFQGGQVRQQVFDLCKGSSRAFLNQTILKTLKFPYCPISEQQKIVEILEEKLSVCNQMEQTIVQSLQQAESLRQSILKQAFEGKLVTIQEEVPAYVPNRIPFYQAQLFGYIIATSANNNIDHGEMTLAKNSYLIDKIYGVPTYFDYGRGHLGPYSIQIKSVLYGGSLKQFFKKGEFHIELLNSDKLFKYTNPYEARTKMAMEELSAIFSQYDDKERPYQTELLATVCKVIEDIQTTDLKSVRVSMKEWNIDLKTTKFKNKAEKFSESDTDSCLNFIIARGWDKRLIS